MKEHKNKRHGAMLPAAAVFVFLFSGCADVLKDGGTEAGSYAQGALTVYFDELGGDGVLMPEIPAQPAGDTDVSGRSIMPETPTVSSYASYTLTFIDPEGIKPELTRNVNASGQTVILDEGTWNVRVDGYIGTYQAASGTSGTPITVADGGSESVSVNLTVLPIGAGAPNGIFAWDISADGISGISAAGIVLDPVADGTENISIDLINAGYSSDAGISVPAGYYDVYITLTKGGLTAGINPVAHIYPGLATRANYSFTEGQFVSTVMLAGTVSITKGADLALSGDLEIRAYQNAARTIQIGYAAVSVAPFGEGVTNAASAEWIMPVPVGDLPADRKPYFKVSATGGETVYTANETVDVPVPDAGMEGISLSLTIMRSEKAITAFTFNSLYPAITESINEIAHTIAIRVPHGTDRSSLAPAISVSAGASVSPAPGIARDFSSPVSYTVTAEDASTQEYVVTVNIESYEGPFYTLSRPALPVLTAGNGSITVTWTVVTGAISYKVYLGTTTTPPAGPSDTVMGLSTTISGLVNETPYYVWVQAVNSGNSSPLSAWATKTLALPAPAAPVLTAGNGSITVTWTAVTEATSYKVYLGTTTIPPAEPSDTVTGLSTTFTGLVNETPYYVWVQAVNTGGESSLSERATKTLALPAPAVPVLTTGDGSITVTWTAVTGAISYKVYLGTTTTPPAEPSDTVTGLSTIFTGLVNETPYYVWVQAVNSGGESALSERATGTLILPAPATPVLTAGNGSITVTWTGVTEATSYKVYLGTTTTPPTEPSDTGTGLSTTFTGLVNEMPYYVWVQAVNTGGESALSERATKTLALPVPATPVLTAGNGSITVTWTGVDLAASYKVYFSTTPTSPAEPSYTGTGLSTTFTGLVNETVYYVWVQAVNAGGESLLSERAIKTLTLPAPAAPLLTTRNGRLLVTWAEVDLAASYKVYLGTITTPPTEPSDTVTGLSTAFTGLVNETPYYVWVQAVNAGGESPLSVRTTGTPTNHYTANDFTTFQSAVSAINSDTASGEYLITITGNFAGTEITFTNNAGKIITIEGDSAVRSISNGNTSTSLFTIPSGIEMVLDNNISLNGAGKSYPVVTINAGGTLTMNSGSKITGASTSGVRIEGGVFIINGGEISGNSASSSYGGGVYISSGSFTMSDGTISSNTTNTTSSFSSAGGGVYISSGSFTMSGGTISGNSARVYGGGVYVATAGSFDKTGGTITATNTLFSIEGGKVAFAANGSKYRETEAGPTTNLNSATTANWGQ
jgi:fibronectin type 3 domain-containing protein